MNGRLETIRVIRRQTKTRTHVYIMADEGSVQHIPATVSAIEELLEIAKARLHLLDLGTWRPTGWRHADGTLEPYTSVDWYLENARSRSRQQQLDVNKLLKLLIAEPWQKLSPHYDVVLTSTDLFSTGTNFVIGAAIPGNATVISTFRLSSTNPRSTHELIKTAVMHEVGHIFGLPSPDRTQNVDKSLGLHCTNRCIMRQGLIVPHDWERFTHDRLASTALCNQCRSDLHRFFTR